MVPGISPSVTQCWGEGGVEGGGLDETRLA